MDKIQHLDARIAARLKLHGVETVICGDIGAGALSELRKAGLQVICGASGRVSDVIEAWVTGKLAERQVACGCTGRTGSRHVECLCSFAAVPKR